MSEIMGHIASEASENNKSEVLVLGRYNLDTYNRVFSIDYKTILAGMQKRFPDQEITFKTVHSSKGVEADYVIILEVVNDFLGFPNEQADDHILDLVLAKSEAFPNSEERRLFYVALTRAKKKVFVSTTSGMSSEFVDEVIQSPFDCEIWGRKSTLLPPCSKCVEGKLLLKTSEFGSFWGCNNHPYCEFRSSACPHCKEGYPKIRADKRLICDVCEQIVIACSRPARVLVVEVIYSKKKGLMACFGGAPITELPAAIIGLRTLIDPKNRLQYRNTSQGPKPIRVIQRQTMTITRHQVKKSKSLERRIPMLINLGLRRMTTNYGSSLK